MKVRPITEPAAALIDECVDTVDGGGIIAVPTRRWYMLCTDSANAEACRLIFDGKGRPITKALALIMPSNEAVDRQPALTPAEVARFVERTSTPVDLLVDGGICPLGVGLTVVDCATTPQVVRDGAVHFRAITAALGTEAA